MSRPRVIDAFPFAGTPTEQLLLECRLTELYDAVDGFICVEARVDHQDHPKPLNYDPDRYTQWADKITYVVADRLPTLEEDPGPWGRETAQREWIGKGLMTLSADNDDIVLQSDVDEIPAAICARNVRPHGRETVKFQQRGHFWAIDWLYPPGWGGTTAIRAGALVGPCAFSNMRNTRNQLTPMLPDAGWHFSWLGGPDVARAKVGAFCHPEVADRILPDPEKFWREGVHVDGVQMIPVEVDDTWPVWMQNPANVPDNWYRPR